MLTIARLFGKSPFALLQTHMSKVASCVSELPSLFQALVKQEMNAIALIGERISTLEHEADLTKNDIRNHLPKSLFLQVDRTSLLDILSLQDAIADQTEAIALHAGMRAIPLIPSMHEDFFAFCNKNLDAFSLAFQVLQELEELLESSFGGIEAQKVKGMVEKIAFTEYEMTNLKNKLIKKLYNQCDEMPYPVFHLFLTMIEEIGRLACLSEKLGNRVRMLLEIK
ncbi:MAG: TIGR00153 family protein [Parachlamydiales bacterium]|nr:TIGR00153 family protein [Parachlamydiales bacterium]